MKYTPEQQASDRSFLVGAHYGREQVLAVLADEKALLKWIRDNKGEGNPEGYTEMHSYHVWEVCNAIKKLVADI